MSPEDKVCKRCRGILRWYPPVAMYLHTGSTGRFVIKDHKPEPIG
jgi:hypothetical protein